MFASVTIHLVVKGYDQILALDYVETHIVSPSTVRVVLSLALS